MASYYKSIQLATSRKHSSCMVISKNVVRSIGTKLATHNLGQRWVQQSGPTFLLLITCVSSILSQDLGQNASAITECPTWFTPDDNDHYKCVCGVGHGDVSCMRNHNQVGIVHCMTFTDGQTLVGHCPYLSSPIRVM